MAKQIRAYSGDPEVCPNLKEIVRHSKFHWRAECKMARKPQDCIDTGQCTQWVKIK